MEIEQEENILQTHRSINPDRLRQAQNIFGESNEQPAYIKTDLNKAAPVSNLKDFFNADEIDDPFNTEAD